MKGFFRRPRAAVWATAAAALAALAFRVTSVGLPLPSGGEADAAGVAREVERLAAGVDLWPGFDPIRIPLAVFDGERTFLFRYPSPPEGFHPLEDAGTEAWVFEGRHPAVTSNSSAEIGGVATATLAPGKALPEQDASRLAAVALHEAFHVFQRERHPGWQGNEADLFLYPTEDARLLKWRRLETEALRRALAEPQAESSTCWARLALDYRGRRFSAMEPAFSEYEKKTELNEGLAAYVQVKVEGGAPDLPAAGFEAADVRQRAYQVGPALALLSDRFAAAWKRTLESGAQPYLEDPLRTALAELEPSKECGLSASETEAIEAAAETDASRVGQDRVQRRLDFDSRAGWRVALEAAEGEPLWLQGFDPLNVQRVEGGLLHVRFLRLGNESLTFEMLGEKAGDIEALTEALGPHPLFNGVVRVTVAVAARPKWESEGGRIALRSPGLKIDCGDAALSPGDREIRIIPRPKP